EIAGLPAAARRERHHMTEQHAAVGALPLRIGVGKMRAQIAERQRAENRVAHRVQQYVGVRMAVEAAVPGNRDAAEDELAPHDERMHVEPVSDAHAHVPGHGVRMRMLLMRCDDTSVADALIEQQRNALLVEWAKPEPLVEAPRALVVAMTRGVYPRDAARAKRLAKPAEHRAADAAPAPGPGNR